MESRLRSKSKQFSQQTGVNGGAYNGFLAYFELLAYLCNPYVYRGGRGV